MQGYPLKAGERRAIPLGNTLLPEYLRKLGYATHLVGKWHTGYYSDYHTPAYRGFDTFMGYYTGYISYFNHTIEQDVSFFFFFERNIINPLRWQLVRGP